MAAATPIRQLIPLLALRRFYFLLAGPDVRQIVTVSDLNRLPVRVYLFTILSHLEGLMADLLVDEFPDDAWLGELTERQRANVRGLYDQKKGVDVDTRLIDCTTLTQKFAIISKNARLRVRFGRTSKATFERYVQPVKELRDRLTHGLDPIEEPGEDERNRNATIGFDPMEVKGAEQLECARDHLMHGAALSRRRDPAWLASVNATIQQWLQKSLPKNPRTREAKCLGCWRRVYHLGSSCCGVVDDKR